MIARRSRVRCHCWRDALLTLTTRDSDFVAFGPILPDGSGCARPMNEGVVLRIFYALELLYPSVLFRHGSLRWRVCSRGAAYQHLLDSLRRLGRGEHADVGLESMTHSVTTVCSPGRKRAKSSADLPSSDGVRDVDGLLLPSIVTRLWYPCPSMFCCSSHWPLTIVINFQFPYFSCFPPLTLYLSAFPLCLNHREHQQRGRNTVVAGVQEGKRGFADVRCYCTCDGRVHSYSPPALLREGLCCRSRQDAHRAGYGRRRSGISCCYWAETRRCAGDVAFACIAW